MSTHRFGNWEVEVRNVIEWPEGVLKGKQTHGGHIARVVELLGGEIEADGVFAKAATLAEGRGITGIGIATADCLPLVLLAQDAALVLHVSRKTLINGLMDNVDRFLDPQEITHVFIGPHICSEHFTFEWEGPEITRFVERFPEAAEQDDQGIWSLSTREAIRGYLEKWSVAESQVTEDDRCTYEASELPSYRRNSKDKFRYLATVVRALAIS
jgi:copper oxidase (laccase) domain-containing protein